MRDYSRFPAPREVPVGGSLDRSVRSSPNRGLTYSLLGCAFLCICVASGVGAFTVPIPGLGAPLISYEPNTASAPNTPSRPSPTNTPGRSSSSPSQPTPIPFSRSVRNSEGIKVTVTYWQRPLPVEKVNVPEGQELAVVSLRIENTGEDKIALKPTDFTLVTADNEQYNPDKGTITTGVMLKTMDLKAGEIVEGDLVYFIRTDAKDVSLAWKSSDGVRLFSLRR